MKLNLRVFGKTSELAKISSRENIDLHSTQFFKLANLDIMQSVNERISSTP